MRGFGEKNEAPNWKKSAKNDSNSKGESCAKGHAMLAVKSQEGTSRPKSEGMYPLELPLPYKQQSSLSRPPLRLLASFSSVDFNFL